MMSSDAELAAIVSGGSKRTSLPELSLLHQIFERQASVTPFNIAAEFVEKNERLSYWELNERANRLALHLHHLGIRPGNIVAIYLPRGIEQYVSMLAILKAGGAYLPIDADFPEERIRFILKDAEVEWAITCQTLSSGVALKQTSVILLDDFSWNDGSTVILNRNLDKFCTPDPTDLCYVIYTSGTTGYPKGVGISHVNAVTFVKAVMDVYGLRSNDRVLQGFSSAFDASVEEIWMAFSSGATLVVGSLETMHTVDELPARLREFGITVFSTVPTLLRAMNHEDLPLLRMLLFGGEAAWSDIIEKWSRPGRKLFNGYGPTECTVVATYDWCKPEVPVTIDEPLPGYEVVILNSNHEEVSGSEEGELCIGGTGVSLKGYINRPRLNSEKFFIHNGKRFYRTGDLAKRNEDGKLVFCGRIDSQVKIRGYRIEFEEIEAHLARLVDCEGAIVNAQAEKETGNLQLVAYIIHRKRLEIDLGTLVTSLRRSLPSYMIPSHFIWLDPKRVPRMTSGKVDRSALPLLSESSPLVTDMGSSRETSDKNARSTEIERKLTEIWRDVLKVSPLPDTSFFDCGGDSVRAAEFIARCRQTEGLSLLCIRDLYQYSTVRAIAQYLQIRIEFQSTDSAGRQKTAKAHSILTNQKAARSMDSSPCAYRVSRLQYVMCTSMQALVILSLIAMSAYATYSLIYYGWNYLKDWISSASLLWIGISAVAVLPALKPVFFCLTLLLAIFLKWLIVGRFKEGEHPLWSWGYFRWWLANLMLAPVRGLAGGFVGSPLICILYRILGAKIGKGVYLGSALAEADLITIGDGASIANGVILRSHTIENGLLKLRRIHIGKNAFVGAQSVVSGKVYMGNNSKLHHLSCLTPGTVTPENSEWHGSPAVQLKHSDTALSRLLKRHEEETREGDFWTSWKDGLRIQLLQFLFSYIFGLILLIPFAAQLLLLFYLEIAYGAVLSLNLRILLPAAFVFSTIGFFGMLASIIFAKRIMTGRAKPGTIRLNSLEYVRRWFCGRLMGALVSPIGTRGVTETLLMPYVCRWLGMCVGKNTEISDASGFQPDLVRLGNDSMLADRCMLGVPIVHRGRMTMDNISIGDRTFIGNAAHVPIITRKVQDRCLIGVLSIAPDEMEPGTDWLGSPPMHLRKRTWSSAPDRYTFKPPKRLYFARAFFNLWKMILPGALVVIVLLTGLKLIVAAYLGWKLGDFLIALPFLLIGTNLALLSLPILFKWGLVWRYRCGERPLWSHWMWRIEIVYEIELLIMSIYRSLLNGTPFLNLWYRFMGAKIGSRVCIHEGSLMEPDLVRLDDHVSVEGFLQTHLFEDRIMKLGPVEIEKGCSIGSESCVLYNSKMGAYSTLADLSLIMKYETFLPHRKYSGLPAENVL